MAEDHSTTGVGREQKKEVKSCFVSFVKGSSWNHQDVVMDDDELRKKKTELLLQD